MIFFLFSVLGFFCFRVFSSRATGGREEEKLTLFFSLPPSPPFFSKTSGMSEAVGPRFVDSDSGGGGGGGSSSSNPDTAKLVDAEVGSFLREARDRVAALLKNRERDLHRLAGALLEHETLTGEDVAAVLNGSFSKAPPVSGGGGSGSSGGSGTTKEDREVLAALGVDVDGDGIGDMARVNKKK